MLTCSSFSKTLAPGLRAGWVVANNRFKERLQNLKAGVSVSTSTLDQYLLAKFLATGAYDRHLRTLRNALKKQLLRTAAAIKKHFPAETRLAVPEGGTLLWVELPHNIDSLALYQQAMTRRISIVPGGGVCSNTRQFNHFIQIGCGVPFTQQVEKRIQTLGELINKMP